MGKASRRKRQRRPRERATAPAGGSGTPSGGSRRRPAAVAAGAVVVLALGLAVWLAARGEPPSALRPNEAAPATARPPLPDPDTSVMTPPVARAISRARAAAVAAPDSAAAVGRLGEVLQAHWLNNEAAACYEIARGLAPAEFRWVYLLAGVEDIRGADGERIDELFREAVRLAPEYAPVYVRYADALMRLGRWAEARDLYSTALERDADLVLAHRGLGQAEVQLGRGSAAVESLERAAAMAPEDRNTQIALARAYTVAGRGDEAAAAARNAQSFTGQASLPDQVFFEVQGRALDPETLRGRLTRRLRQGDMDAALEILDLLEESEGDGARRRLAQASKARANRLAYGGDFDAALPEFERASRLAPADPEIEHNWGTVLLRQGELDRARQRFERAVELDPQSPDSLYNLGVVLEGLGRADEAVERFRAAVAIEPRHVAAEHLAQLGVPPGT